MPDPTFAGKCFRFDTWPHFLRRTGVHFAGKCSIADARPRPLKNRLSFVPQVRSFDFDDLMASLASLSEKVHIEPHHGYWMDIRPQDDNETVVPYCEANPQKFE
jgi:NDP-sugar pyrophosphorylase family protein